MFDDMMQDAKRCNAAARDAGWFEMNWQVMETIETRKERDAQKAEQRGADCQPPNITEIQRSILQAVADGARNSNRVAIKTGMRRNYVASHARHIEQRGLLTIAIHGKTANKRQMFFTITDLGRAALRGAE